MVAYNDLGGLGSKQGAPVFYNWPAPNLLPLALPWLPVLGLLMLRPNRRASAWWIWLPLACVGGPTFLAEPLLASMAASTVEMLLDWVFAVGSGLAAVWLLAGYLGRKHRVLAFVGILAAQGAFGFLAAVMRLGSAGLKLETLPLGIGLGPGVVAVSVALALAGLGCRGRYGWLRLSLWLIVALGACWLVIVGPPYILGRVASGIELEPLLLLSCVVSATAMTFGVMLPFLLLSFVNGFYRERLKGLLHLGGQAPPPLVPPPEPAAPEVAAGCTCFLVGGPGGSDAYAFEMAGLAPGDNPQGCKRVAGGRLGQGGTTTGSSRVNVAHPGGVPECAS